MHCWLSTRRHDYDYQDEPRLTVAHAQNEHFVEHQVTICCSSRVLVSAISATVSNGAHRYHVSDKETYRK